MSNCERPTLREILPVLLTAWGTYYVISGIKTMGINTLLQTAMGGCMVYLGVQGCKAEEADDSKDLLFDQETDNLAVSEDSTLV